MTNVVWIILILSGVFISVLTGEINNIGNIILSSTNDAFSLFIKMSLMILFWNGVFNIFKDSGFLKKLTRYLSKILSFIFPEVDPFSETMEYISITLLSNILGLGVASTSTGLKAFALLKEERRKKKGNLPTKSMITFIILNISTITIFPTTIISMRNAYLGSTDFRLLFVVFVTTFFGSIIGLLSTLIFTKGEK